MSQSFGEFGMGRKSWVEFGEVSVTGTVRRYYHRKGLFVYEYVEDRRIEDNLKTTKHVMATCSSITLYDGRLPTKRAIAFLEDRDQQIAELKKYLKITISCEKKTFTCCDGYSIVVKFYTNTCPSSDTCKGATCGIPVRV